MDILPDLMQTVSNTEQMVSIRTKGKGITTAPNVQGYCNFRNETKSMKIHSKQEIKPFLHL